MINKSIHKFNQQYTLHPKKNEEQKGITLRTTGKLEIEGRLFICNTEKEAISDTKKSNALRSDRLAPIHLHPIGPIALRYLADTIYFSVDSAKTPNIWKFDRFIHIHKTGKPIDESGSFRPIALLPLIQS